MSHKLSIIVPFAGEYPQVLFTLQSIRQSLPPVLDDKFEVIAVNNYCFQLREQIINSFKNAMRRANLARCFTPEALLDLCDDAWPKLSLKDRSGEAVAACAKVNPWLRYLEYDDKLSHWQAKRIGVEAATGDTFLFIDAHCVPSYAAISQMFYSYWNLYSGLGTLHLPLTYKVLESHRLIYKMNVENGLYSYKFTRLAGDDRDFFEVPVMSTCGMMISRKIYEEIGGWPKGLGIYGGGENFINYTLAVCGYKKWIFTPGTLFHHGERRDYHYLYDDMARNRALAHYLFGGEHCLDGYLGGLPDDPAKLAPIRAWALESGAEQRKIVKAKTTISLEDWLFRWTTPIATDADTCCRYCGKPFNGEYKHSLCGVD